MDSDGCTFYLLFILTSNALLQLSKFVRADPAKNDKIVSRIPIKRWALPEEQAAAAIWLASSASDYVCGEIVAVDGGWLQNSGF